MRTVQDVFFGVEGQTLHLDVTEGRPSSVTSVEVFPWDASDDADSEWSATGAVETNPNTTLDAAAGASQSDRTLIPLTATTGAAEGRVYLITNAAGRKEWVEVAEVASGVSVSAKHPLHNDYASGTTFQSTRITATVDNTWAGDSTNLVDAGPNPGYRVRWVYVVAGATHVADTYFNLVRYAGAHGVRPQDVESISAGWLDRLPTDHRVDQGRRLIDEAYRAVKLDLHGIWTDDAMVANAEAVDIFTAYKRLVLDEQNKETPNLDALKVARDAYQVQFDSLARITNKLPIRDTTAASSERPALGLSRR